MLIFLFSAPDEKGDFSGQNGYGYISFEKFVDAVNEVNITSDDEKSKKLDEIDRRGLPTLANTVATGAILEAGRRSLDNGGKTIKIVRSGEGVEGWSLE